MLCLPVSDPDFWNLESVQRKLQEVLGFVSEDLWSFSFDESQSPEQLLLGTDERVVRNNPDCVVLFSGGSDSLCAAVEAAEINGGKPVLVSHRAHNAIEHRQKSLVAQPRQAIPDWPFPHSGFVVNRVQTRE